jgi:hypothetical protein
VSLSRVLPLQQAATCLVVALLSFGPPHPSSSAGESEAAPLRATGAGYTWVALAWSPLPVAGESFLLERRADGGPWEPLRSVDLSAGEYTDTDLAPGVTYTYRLAKTKTLRTPALRGGAPPMRISMPISGARELILEASPTGDSARDHAIWAHPVLLRADGAEVALADLRPASVRLGWGEPREPGISRIGGSEYPGSVWAPAPSRLTYELDGSFQRFESAVGLEESEDQQGPVEFAATAVLPDDVAGSEVTLTTADWFRSPGDTTYYVDAEGGADSNDGTTESTAWRTLDKVNAAAFAPGDRLLFRAGTRYVGQLVLRGSGLENRPILVGAYGDGPRPRIEAEGRYDAALALRNGEYWEIAGLEITNTARSRAPHRTGVLIEASDFGTAHHIHLKDLYIHDVNSALEKDQGGAGLRWYNGGEKVPSRFDDLLIEGCHLLRTDRNGIVGDSGYWSRERWNPSTNVVIRGNLLEDIGGDGIVPIGCDGALIEHNVLRGGRTRCPDYAAGIWPWSCDNTVVQFNEVSGMKGTKDGQGFDSDWNCRNTLIQYNYSHDNEGGFLLICNDGGVAASTSVGNIGTVVRYNISQNDGARTFQISAVKDTTIYNNTIYVGPGLAVYALYCHSWSGWAENTHFLNNIFYADGTMRYEFGNTSGTMFSNNAFFGHQAERPADPESVSRDPGLLAPGGGGQGRSSLRAYTLRSDSPCLGAGLLVADNGGRDFWGDAVPQGRPPDIGADQRLKVTE